MAKLNILGTGNAMVTKCFNSCFTISNNNGEHFLIDTGGGNGVLTHLEKINVSISRIHNIFISHTHNDHINGINFVIRAVAQAIINGKYDGNLNIFGHSEVLKVAEKLCTLVLENKFTKFFNDRIHFIPVKNNETVHILDFSVNFFDIKSSKRLQYGFKLTTEENVSLTFIGDEPYKPELYNYCYGVDYLFHEAFCLYEERDLYNPYEKHHTTVKEACENASELNVTNIILFHTEDNHILNRKEYYSAEGRYFFNKNILVPNDLEEIELIKEENVTF